jgi:hypothetical protein
MLVRLQILRNAGTVSNVSYKTRASVINDVGKIADLKATAEEQNRMTPPHSFIKAQENKCSRLKLIKANTNHMIGCYSLTLKFPLLLPPKLEQSLP